MGWQAARRQGRVCLRITLVVCRWRMTHDSRARSLMMISFVERLVIRASCIIGIENASMNSSTTSKREYHSLYVYDEDTRDLKHFVFFVQVIKLMPIWLKTFSIDILVA